MNKEEVKYKAQTGDALITVSSIWVRIFTAESFSHAAIILVEDDEVYVVEVHECTGYTTKTLFDHWITRYEQVYLGIPEEVITSQRDKVKEEIYKYLNKPKEKLRYGYLTLPLVWLNQLFPKKKFKHKLNVCSTLVGEIWRAVGWEKEGLSDPGDIFKACEVVYKID